jgi:hypothetical protein
MYSIHGIGTPPATIWLAISLDGPNHQGMRRTEDGFLILLNQYVAGINTVSAVPGHERAARIA